MAIPEVLRTNLVPGVFGTLLGSLVTYIISKVTNKTARLRYSTSVERIAMATDDEVFGSVRITWGNGNSMRNLYLATLEVENSSSRDYEDVDLKVYCAKETLLLGERTSVADSPYAVLWSPSFRESLIVPPGEGPSQNQFDVYNHTREYKLPVFNRGQILHFSYLCTRPNDDVTPGVFLSTQLKGARLVPQSRRSLTHGVPTQIALIHGLVIAFISAAACSYFLHSTPTASVICILVGLFAQSIGAVEYKLGKLFWKLLAG